MSKPPFRADHVGSLLRPLELSDARQQWRDGTLDAEGLKALEDQHIREIINFQEDIGLKSITDGEFRRDYWHLDFITGFEGITLNEETYGHAFSGGGTVGTFSITDKVGKHSGYMRDHFKFLNENTTQTAKFCIPGPGMTHLRSGRQGISETAYPDMESYWPDIIAAYAAEINEMAELGCTYLQIDDVSFAYLCDEDFRKDIVERGDDPDQLLVTYAQALSQAIADRPAGMTVTTHMCRGNFQSTWMTSGGYESVAERMFDEMKVDGYFMEYDSDRAGGFEPLRFVPKDRMVVLGLITSKTPELESKDDIKRRIDEAAQYIDLDQLCLSPQCGFSSTHHGNNLTRDEQRRKLELVVEIANDVWGEI
ncbi:MAG: 5-methyltetrahydropteroyltriglutamate--homocysteine S-methyltransferase [Rhodospirillaceae bacterium]|jgi:5-methyltetrahydropteroyltriglutamate--homocysteine methyltransferase|nr:5-methyltetrahydropteroyltriglutamate--homocysteine S-methyltransferase [Rhodospirillaceae bacterium]MBT4939783.1 5-methyltetrahydropteroyltriglutamate--homocysteine S-methyltransferase [Rhodospirillaceae bacterium]MBT7268125.1 5-methyltetrahydropteroyltriglutamate--homocysteine S-methyltransferase [Rhodospirillaceae bacterium]